MDKVISKTFQWAIICCFYFLKFDQNICHFDIKTGGGWAFIRAWAYIRANMEQAGEVDLAKFSHTILKHICFVFFYSKTCLKRRLKNRKKTKVLKTNGSLMKVQSIAECSWSILQYFDLH